MGRPLNKRLFTDAATGATAAANEIKVNFNAGAGVKEGTIIKQKGSKKFVVAETCAGVHRWKLLCFRMNSFMIRPVRQVAKT